MKTNSSVPSVGWLFGLLVALVPARGIEISLDFNSLPSSQGWSYFNLGQIAAESDVFSISGGVLRMNTIGIGGGRFDPGSTQYRLTDVVDPFSPFSISIRARVLADEDFVTGERPFGFSFSVFTGTEQVGVGLSTTTLQTVDSIRLGTGGPMAFDTTEFHTYQLNVTPGVGYNLWVDSELFTSGQPVPIEYQNGFNFGDGTGAANAHAEVTSFAFSQQVPEPEQVGLMLLGLAALSISRFCGKCAGPG